VLNKKTPFALSLSKGTRAESESGDPSVSKTYGDGSGIGLA